MATLTEVLTRDSHSSNSLLLAPFHNSFSLGVVQKVLTLRLQNSSSSQEGSASAIAGLMKQIEMLHSPENLDTVIEFVRSEIQMNKASMLSDYQAICGECFEDTDSTIHKLWANFAREEKLYNASAQVPFDQTNPSAAGIDSAVYKAFIPFLTLDLEARALYKEIINLGGTYTSDPVLAQALVVEKEALIENDDLLCGTDSDDLTAPLPKARKEYEDSLSSSSDSSAQLAHLKQLEKQHAANVRNIYLIDQMLVAPYDPEASVVAIAHKKIEFAVASLQSQLSAVQENSSKPLVSSSIIVKALDSSSSPTHVPHHSVILSERDPIGDARDPSLTSPQGSDSEKVEERTEASFERVQSQTHDEMYRIGYDWTRAALIALTVAVTAPIAVYGAYQFANRKG